MNPRATGRRRRESLRASATTILGACVLFGARVACADDGQGRIPIWGLGMAIGAGNRDVMVLEAPLFPGDMPTPESQGATSGILGPAGWLNLDFDAVVVTASAFATATAPATFGGSAGAVIGWRQSMTYWSLSQDGSAGLARTQVPMTIGFYAGGGLSFIGDQTNAGGDAPVPGATIGTLEGGFGMMSQLQIIAAGTVDPQRGMPGAHVRMGGVLGTGSVGGFMGMDFFVTGDSSQTHAVIAFTFGISDGCGLDR